MELKNLIDGYKRCPAKSKERKISAWASLKPISSIETNWRNRKHIDRRKLVHRSNEDAVTKKSLISPSYEHPPKLPKNLKDRLRLREALATRSLGERFTSFSLPVSHFIVLNNARQREMLPIPLYSFPKIKIYTRKKRRSKR